MKKKKIRTSKIPRFTLKFFYKEFKVYSFETQINWLIIHWCIIIFSKINNLFIIKQYF
jgi:hypothetical protein